MPIAPYIKEIGRGKEGARSLTSEQAHDLMGQVLDGRVTDLEVGAFAIAMRIKGESTDELVGFLQAVHERCLALPAPPRPMVALPSYNGARKLPNLTALLALLLAREGVPVLVHGPRRDPGRVTTAEVFAGLGLPAARQAEEAAAAWARREPVFVAVDDLCPPLARLLDVRWVIGLRNPGHTVAKLLDPARGQGPSLRLCNYTHPEYGVSLAEFLGRTRANAILLRGTEGEPVADPRRMPRLDVYVDGARRAELSVEPQQGVLTELPELPKEFDVAATARHIRAVVEGTKPVPEPLSRQVDCIRRALDALG